MYGLLKCLISVNVRDNITQDQFLEYMLKSLWKYP
jgi:hypothetical protein